jgi:CBS domain-containing protein
MEASLISREGSIRADEMSPRDCEDVVVQLGQRICKIGTSPNRRARILRKSQTTFSGMVPMTPRREGDPLEEVEAIMAAAQVRRLPVIDKEGKLCGMVSLGDLAHHTRKADKKPDALSLDRVAATLAAICRPPDRFSLS